MAEVQEVVIEDEAGTLLRGSWSPSSSSLSVSPPARGVVVFAHGSGSGRSSPRNQFVAGHLQRAGYATLLLDLLTEEEDERDARTGALRFDIPLLASRVVAGVDAVRRSAVAARLPVALLGSSTGAAAALLAAVARPLAVAAVVARGGRPDLALDALPMVRAPTLLIVGGLDDEVLRLNQQALALLRVPKTLAIVPGATHLFPEPGALSQVAALARSWFDRFLPSSTLVHAPEAP
jgi:putative phosphoribosyl transferase